MVCPSMLETLPLRREALDPVGDSVNRAWPDRDDGGVVTAEGFRDLDPFVLGSDVWLGSDL